MEDSSCHKCTRGRFRCVTMEVIEALQLQPVGYDTIAVFGGVKEAGLYQVSIGLPAR